MKITVYTTTDCQFSKQEREYLASHNLQYEEKNLETNKDFLTEMLAVSNNFAGTPVTRVEKDDSTITVLKGFTPGEFDTTFGFTATPSTTTPKPPKAEELVKPTDTPMTTTPSEVPITPSNPPPTNQETSSDPQLNSVLDKLEEKTDSSAEASTKAETPAAPTETTPLPPSNPSPTGEVTSPSIPDFPTDAAAQPIK